MKKIAFYAFRKEKMCFVHLLINALDMHEKGQEVKIIVEGEAVRLLQTLEEEQNQLYTKAKEQGLFDGICQACSKQLGVLEYNKKIGIPLKNSAQGHPAMREHLQAGYQIITL